MTPVELSNPVYNNEDAARAHLEAVRWPTGPTCPHCGSTLPRALNGLSMGPGWFYCPDCQDKFTVRTGTIWERSHIPLHKWLLASRLMASSKKGFSAHQLSRTLDITYKSAWFMAHRIREAMRDTDATPLGGEGEIVESDETYVGPPDYEFRDGSWKGVRGVGGKIAVVTLVQRNGKARSVKIEKLNMKNVQAFVEANADKQSRLMTDEARMYKKIGKDFASHETVNHSKKEYARGDVTTNTVEGFFSIFKRGMTGVYQHCGEQHLQRYLDEFDFRYSNRIAVGVDDAERTTRTLKGAEGKRLTYRRTNKRTEAKAENDAG